MRLEGAIAPKARSPEGGAEPPHQSLQDFSRALKRPLRLPGPPWLLGFLGFLGVLFYPEEGEIWLEGLIRPLRAL